MTFSKKSFIPTIITLFLEVRIITGVTWDPAKCTVKTDSDGLLAADCTNNPFNAKGPYYTFHLRSNIPASIQVIDGSGRDGGPSGMFIDENSFEEYPNVQKIILRNLQQFTEVVQNEADVGNGIRIAFKKLESLRYLEIVNSNLDNTFALIELPKNLKTVNVSNNHYEFFNASSGEAIEEINANDNALKNIPTLHYTIPPLHKLYLKRNPLNEMTVLDIASLCELTLLEVEFPAKSHYASENGYCDCEMLKTWTKEFEIKGFENVTCVKPAGDKKCSQSKLAEARSLHKRCPLLKKYGLSGRLFTIIQYVFFIILLLLILAVAILYVIRHFHLREWYAQHHLFSHPTSIKMEEGEEEPFSDPDSSETASEYPSERNESNVEE